MLNVSKLLQNSSRLLLPKKNHTWDQFRPTTENVVSTSLITAIKVTFGKYNTAHESVLVFL